MVLLTMVMQASMSFSHMNVYRTIDPMLDFVVPQSLTQCLHEGFIAVEDMLSNFSDTQHAGPLLSDVSSALKRLHDTYDTMIGKSNINRLYNDDREFLQKMIDRIDSMIQDLEKSMTLSDADKVALEENVQLVQQLRSKI